MYSDERQSTRSPTTSRTDSYRDGLMSRTNDRSYQGRSPITGENDRDDNEYEEALDDVDESPRNSRPPQRSEDQYIAALRYRFPNRPVTDYSYSRPPGPTIPIVPSTNRPTPTRTTTTPGTTTTPRNGAYQSSVRPSTSGTNTPDTTDDRPALRPALRRVNPDQQNTYARRFTAEATGAVGSTGAAGSTGSTGAARSTGAAGAATTTPRTTTAVPTAPPITPMFQSQSTTPGLNVRITEPDMEGNRPTTSTFTRQSGAPRTDESIFEKVPPYGGPVSYLGTGTFSQFEHCLQECLERERLQRGYASHIVRHDAHDYGYNSVLPSSSSYHESYPTINSQLLDYPLRPNAMFSLDDIRQINVALSRSGISLFPYQRLYHETYNRPCHESYRQPYDESFPSSISLPSTTLPNIYPSERRITREVVSACRVVEEDPAMLFSRNGPLAVQNVWNAIQNHRPSSCMDPSRSIVSSRGPYNI